VEQKAVEAFNCTGIDDMEFRTLAYSTTQVQCKTFAGAMQLDTGAVQSSVWRNANPAVTVTPKKATTAGAHAPTVATQREGENLQN
jgi:hypothetical protein